MTSGSTAERRRGGLSAHVTPVSISFAGGAVLFGLLQLLTQQLSVFHLRTEVAALISAIVGVLALLVSTVKSRAASQQSVREVEAELGQALAIFPPRAVGHVDVCDLGVGMSADASRPAGYVTRTHDPAVAQALQHSGGVIISGPPWSGKTRSAAEVTRQTLPECTLLVPEDANGLHVLLQRHSQALPFPHSPPCVLWLDDLERFLAGIDLDALDAWLWPRGRRTARGNGDDAGAPPPPGLRIVATIREEALSDLLAGTSDTGWRLRRLLARTTGVACSDRLDTQEQASAVAAGHDPAATTVRELRPRSPLAAWSPQISGAPIREPRGRQLKIFVPELLAVAIATALCVTLAWRVHNVGWSVPPSLSTQFASVADQTPTCSVHQVYPSSAGLAGQPEAHAQFVALAAQCPGSDRVGFYAVRDGRLVLIGADSPEQTPRPWRFRCLGVGRDPCHVSISAPGSAVATVGAWIDPDSLRPLAVAYVVRGGTVTRTPLPVPARFAAPGPGAHGRAAAAETLPMHPGLAATPPVDPPAGCRHLELATLCSPAIDGLAVVPDASGQHASLLVAARALHGSSIFALQTGGRAESRAWRLSLSPDPERISVSPQPCLLFRHGLAMALEIDTGSSGVPAALDKLWQGSGGSQAVC